MEIVHLIDDNGKERQTTKTAWDYLPERERLKDSHWKLKPVEPVTDVATPEQVESATDTGKKPKKS